MKIFGWLLTNVLVVAVNMISVMFWPILNLLLLLKFYMCVRTESELPWIVVPVHVSALYVMT